jgi:cytidylate kinase
VRAALEYNVPLDKLEEAVVEEPRFLERLSMERAHYLAYVRATLCKEIRDDNVVYHGLGGNLLIGGLPHLIRVRVIADMEFRIKAAMERNQMTRKEAIDHIKKVDEKRAKWTKFLYHVDWNDPSLYDLVINLENLDISDACEIVSKASTLERFKTTPEAQKLMDDLELSTEVRAIIAAAKGIADSGVEIEANEGVITLGGTVGSLQDADRIRELVRAVPGVKDLDSKMNVSSHW